MPGSWIVKGAFRKEGLQNSYGAGAVVACGAGHQLPIRSANLPKEISREYNDDKDGKGGVKNSYTIRKHTQGSVSLDLTYQGLEHLLSCAMGFSNASATVAAGVYKHDIQLSRNLFTDWLRSGDGALAGDGWLAGDKLVRRGTLCLDKNISPIWEYQSCLVNEMRISVNFSSVALTLGLIAYDLDLNSLINTSSTSWTIPTTEWIKLLFSHMTVWIDDYSASVALSSDDAIGVTSFEMLLNNRLVVEQDSQSGVLIQEPRRETPREVTGTFALPRYISDTLLDKFQAGTTQMMMVKFTGPAITGGYYYTFWLWFPSIDLRVVDVTVDSDDIMPVTCEFTAKKPAAIPAGFPSTADDELLIQLQNGVSSNLIRL